MIEVYNDKVFLNYGPIQMYIQTWKNDEKALEISKSVAEKVCVEFENILPYLEDLKKMRFHKKTSKNNPIILNKMIVAVESIQCKNLNTLAAVAGSFSEYAMEEALLLGADRVIINNGGDLALKDIKDGKFKVGVSISNFDKSQNLIIELKNSDNIEGICTSGVKGRSFSKGIADSVVILGKKASLADASATHIANCTNIEHDGIVRTLAENIDSGTDIKGQLITLKVPKLKSFEIYKALYNGLLEAEKLYKRGIILGAIIVVQNKIVKYPEDIEIKLN